MFRADASLVRSAVAAAVLALGAAEVARASGTLQVVVLDGGLQSPGGVQGATVTLEETAHSGTTNVRGQCSIASITSGRYVLRVTGPAGFAPLRRTVEVPDGTLALPPLLLARIPTGTEVVVPSTAGVVTGTTQVEDALVPNARLTVTTGTALSGTSDSPSVAVFPVDRSLSPVPFAGNLEPLRLYSVSKAGLGFDTAQDLRLPNDEALPPGFTVPVFALLPRATEIDSDWRYVGVATVNSTGEFLQSDTAFVRSATLYAAQGMASALPTRYRLRVQDRAGNPVSGATVQVHRVALTETDTPGTYEGDDVVHPGAPLRALVSKDFGGGLLLHALSDPVEHGGEVTLLHQGDALRLELGVSEALCVGGAVLRNGTSSHGTLRLTEATVAPAASSGEGGLVDATTSWSGPLNQTFVGSTAPVVSFVASPSGAVGSPDTAPILSFSLLALDVAFDPDATDPYTTTASLTSASYSLDGGSTWNAVALVANRGDARTALAAPPGGSRYRWAWDLWSTPAPTGITGASQAVLLRATILDAPGGSATTVTAPAFYYQWPVPRVERIEPRDDSTDVFLDSEILVDFEHDMDADTINGTNLVLTSSAGTLTTATATYLADTRQARITFAGNLPTTTAITVTVGTGVENVFGVPLASAVGATFTTGATSALGDDDNDGLLNAEEALLGTDPNDADSDDDGLDDWYELFVRHTNPVVADTDGDGTEDGSDGDPLGTAVDPIPVGDVASVETFLVTSIGPIGDSVPLDAQIAVTFNGAVDASSFDGTNIRLERLAPTSATLTLDLVSQPNPRTLVFAPVGGLSDPASYLVTVDAGPGAIEDTSGAYIAAGSTSTFATGSGAPPLFEPQSYLSTLAMTQWERFPLTAPTAGGRQGMAMVIPATHKLLVAVTDVAVPGRGLPVAISRVYRNNETAALSSGCFGNHWHLQYERTFTVAMIDTDTNVDFVHRSADGRIFNYLSNGESTLRQYKDPPGAHETIHDWVDPATSTFYVIQRERVGGKKSYYRFFHGGTAVTSKAGLSAGDIGVLVMERDRNLNTVEIARYPATDTDRPLRIQTITDDLGRVTTFAYGTGSIEKALVTSIDQFGERTFTYDYDGSGNLTSVGLPGGKSQGFTYTSSGGTHLLTSVVDGLATASMRFVYDAQGDVSQVDYGAGADAGTAVYSWSGAGGVQSATQIDRNGNVLVLEHEAVSTPGFLNVASSALFTRGLHPLVSGGEAPHFLMGFQHDDDGDLTACLFPNGNLLTCIRSKECGGPDQLAFHSWNLGGGEEQEARRCCLTFDPIFRLPTSVTGFRGCDPAVIGGSVEPENVAAQTSAVFVGANGITRDAYTTFTYRDNRDVAAVVSENIHQFAPPGSELIPPSWFIDLADAQVPKGYGHDSASDLPLFKPSSLITLDSDGDGFPDRGGNPVAVRGPRATYVSGCSYGGRQAIETFAAYEQHGQPIFRTAPFVDTPDGRKNRWDRTEFFDSGPMKGFLRKIEVDSKYRNEEIHLDDSTVAGAPTGDGLALTTTFEVDVFGRTTSSTNPRGFKWTTEFDLLDLVVRTIAPEPFGYTKEFSYDDNNNLVQLEVANVVPFDLDDDGLQTSSSEQRVDPRKSAFVHTYAFNTANMLLRETQDAWDGTVRQLVTAYQYDRKQLRVGVRHPAGNADWTRYDERDLIYETVRGASDPATSQTTRFDYDPNGNLLTVRDEDGNSTPSQTITYDGFDRPVTWTDELRNVTTVYYDAAGHVVRRKVVGQERSRSDMSMKPLEHTITTYDELGRPFQIARETWGSNPSETLDDMVGDRLDPVFDVELADPALTLDALNGPDDPGPSQIAYTLMGYDERSNLVGVCDDNGHHTTYAFDSLDRLISTIDAEGSEQKIAYDMASNRIRLTDVEVSPGGMSQETFHAEAFYDGLNRPIATVSNLGNTQRFLYDSRSLLVQTSDAMGALTATLGSLPAAGEHDVDVDGNGSFDGFQHNGGGGLIINRRGNTSRFTYDGLGRALSTTRDLRQDGTGVSIVVGQIVTSATYDDNGRVAQRFDPNGNVTGYVYDHQDRLIREAFADGTDRRFVWVDTRMPSDRSSTIKMEFDPRGVSKSYTYDALERRSDVAISARPAGAGQTTFQAFDYDGLGRRTTGEDDDSRVESWFDSMSRAVKEAQTVETGAPRTSKGQLFSAAVVGNVLRASDGVGNLIKLSYPTEQTFERRYDGVDRLAAVKENFDSPTALATFNHTGQGGRRLSRTYQVGGADRMLQELEYDPDRRVQSLDTMILSGGPLPAGTRIRGFGYAWDRANNRRWERRLTGAYQDESQGPGEAYRYDSAYRLVHDDKDVAAAGLDAISTNYASVPAAPYAAAGASDYVLDATSNRRQTTIAGVTQTYALDASAQTTDLAANQYTFVGNSARSHDLMGNLVGQSDTGRQAFYDADNRLVQWTEGGKDVRYRYDVDGRRTVKEDVGTASFPRTVYFWDGWQTVEETDSSGNLQRQYVWGEGIDECLKATVPDAANLVAGDDIDLYYHHNSLGSVVAVTKADGTVVESYRYSAFGKPTIYNGSNVEIAATAVEQPFMFTGARYDFEEGSGLYQMRLRYYDPVVGRFVSRDPLGLWGDPSQNGNGQGYCGHNPVNWTDPLGLRSLTQSETDMFKLLNQLLTAAESYGDREAKFASSLKKVIESLGAKIAAVADGQHDPTDLTILLTALLTWAGQDPAGLGPNSKFGNFPGNEEYDGVPAPENKCNMFVANVLWEGLGLSFDAHGVTGTYPPVADDWAHGKVDSNGDGVLGTPPPGSPPLPRDKNIIETVDKGLEDGQHVIFAGPGSTDPQRWKPGDIIAKPKGTGAQGHVGIYLGEGLYVSARAAGAIGDGTIQPADGVQITPVDSQNGMVAGGATNTRITVER